MRSLFTPFWLLASCMGLLTLFSCTRLPTTTPYPGTQISVDYGPEDLVRQGDRLLIGCSGGPQPDDAGSLFVYDLGSEKARPFPRKGEPDSLHFRPHGMYLSTQQGKDFLYVVTHDNAKNFHPIVRYEVFEDRVEFRELLHSPFLVSPNALVVSEDGSFFLGNDVSKRGNYKEVIFGLKKCTVVWYDGKGNWRVAADKVGMITGINRIKDHLYISATRENCIYRYTIKGGILTDKTLVTETKGPDNLRIDGDALLTSGHYSATKFIKHKNDTLKPAPTVVSRIPPGGGEPEILFSDPGEVISAGSGAIRVGNTLYMAQVFRSFILKVEIPEK